MSLNGKRSTISVADLPVPAAGGGMPAWMQQMREAARACIGESDITEIVRGQVERAKKGDAGAIKFVFDQVLGGAAFKGATIIQNNTENHYAAGGPGAAESFDPKRPIRQGASAEERVAITKLRLDAGLPLQDPRDAADRSLD
jgi:hypothetical protein